jgi:hypothetical protein
VIELKDVRNEFIAIAALEEELEVLERDKKRLKEDIASRLTALRKRVTAPSDQLEIDNVTPIGVPGGMPLSAGTE